MTAWDISTAVFQNSKLLTASPLFPSGIFFRSDGLKLYVATNENPSSPSSLERIDEYNVAIAWDISSASFVQSFNVKPNTDAPVGVWFRPDGLRMFVGKGDSSSTRIHQYTLTTPWNISTASFSITSIDLTSIESVLGGIFFRDDGLKVYLVGSGSDSVHEFNLTTAYDITNPSLVYVQSKSVSIQDTFPDGVFFKPDGTKMYITGATNDRIYEYNLSTPWNISTAVFFQSFLISAQDTNPASLFLKSDGSRVYHTGNTNGRIYSYDLSITPSPCTPPCVFFDPINTNTGWNIVGLFAGNMIFIDSPSFPDTIRLNSLTSGGGSFARYAYKDIGTIVSGNARFEFKLEYDNRAPGGFSPEITIGLCSSTAHPQQQTGSFIRVDSVIPVQPYLAMKGIASDGVTTKVTSSGSKNQHSVWMYPNNNNPISDDSLKGPYYVRIELNDNKLRLSVFKDSNRTQHMRGSPITVDATGVNLTNLRYVMVGNGISGGSGRQFTGFIDDFRVSTNAPLELVPQKFVPATGSFVETWDGYVNGDQNPTPWISINEVSGGAFTSLIDIHEVSPEAPIEGTKAFKIDQRYNRTGSGSRNGRVSVSRFLPAIVRTDGSGLDIPLALSAKMRADILSLQLNPIGVMVGYELILGTPNITTTRGILFKLYGSGSQAFIWNGTEWITNNSSDVPVSLSNPAGDVSEIESINLKGAFDNSAILSETNAWDFESHVTGIWVGYIGVNNSSSSTPTEVLIHGDTISMLNAGIEIEVFTVGAIIEGIQPIEFTVNAILIKERTFTIDAHIPPIPKTPKIDARLVRRTAVNSAVADAILLGTVTITTQTETFLIDGNIKQPLYEPFSLDAKLIRIQQKSLSIDGTITPLRAKTTKIDALVGIFEPMSILDVESVIGHEV